MAELFFDAKSQKKILHGSAPWSQVLLSEFALTRENEKNVFE